MIRVAIAVVEKGPLFLIERRKQKIGSLVWSLPGGRLKAGERSEDAAVREVKEETGVSAQAVSMLGERVDGENRQIDYWLCNYVSGEAHVAEPEEVQEVRWAAGQQALGLFASSMFAPVADYMRRVRS